MIMTLNYLKDILLEEIDRKQRAKNVFEKKLKDDLIYTQVKIKKISDKEYLYVFSIKEKKDKYIGLYSYQTEEFYLKLIKKREDISKQLQSVLEDITKLEKMVNII